MTESVWTHRTMIIPAAIADQVRGLAASFGPAAAGMWIIGLSPTGETPATHFISAGMIDQPFAEMMGSPEALVSGCAALDIIIPLAMAQALLGAADVSEEEPFAALDRLGLKLLETGV